MCSRRRTHWDESFPRTPAYREVTPPRPVTINLDQAVARDSPPLRTVNPLRVTAGGLRLTGYCPGLLHAWIRLNTGTWLAECSFTVHSGNHRGTLDLRQCYPPVLLPHDRTRHRTDQGRSRTGEIGTHEVT